MTDETAARIAQIEAAIRYWEGEAARSPERAAEAQGRLAECRERLSSLRGGGPGDAGC